MPDLIESKPTYRCSVLIVVEGELRSYFGDAWGAMRFLERIEAGRRAAAESPQFSDGTL